MTTPIRTLCIFVLLISTSLGASAAKPDMDIKALLHLASMKSLAKTPYWRALGHYLPAHNTSGFSSEITSPGFFLSSNGANDPQQELEATLSALFLPAGENPDQHAQCRFIARFHWLKKQLDLDAFPLPHVQCRQFQKWSLNGQIESLSLVFATGYLDNPASYYGHILLKFNTRRNILVNELQDQSLNFGANIPPQENPVMYVLRGIFGGYNASFSDDKFYRHNHNYGENELRDLWVYELALDESEVQQLIEHSWELLDNTFTYYFLKENCAYRMAELLELVIDEPLLPQNLPWSMPATVFDDLMRLEHHGHPLVRNVRLIPSRQNRFYDKYFALTPSQQHWANTFSRTGFDQTLVGYQELSPAEKIAIIDCLFDYYEFRIAVEDDDTGLQQARHKLLMARAKLPAGKAASPDHALPLSPPHLGPLPGLFRVGAVHGNTLGNGLELQFRPAYYDSLSIDSGRLPDSQLTMFDLHTLYRNKKLTLRRLDFINVKTLNVSRTNMPGDGGRAWSLRVGLDNQDLSCDDCGVLRASGAIGKATSLTRNTVIYGMVGGFAQSQYHNSGTLGAKAQLGLWTMPTSGWKSQLMIGTIHYLNGTKHHIPLLQWENRFGNSRQWDIRLSYRKWVEHELNGSVSLYW